MKNIYKLGGVRKTPEGIEYTVRSVGDEQRESMLSNGWVNSIEELKPESKQEDLLTDTKEEPKKKKTTKKAQAK